PAPTIPTRSGLPVATGLLYAAASNDRPDAAVDEDVLECRALALVQGGRGQRPARPRLPEHEVGGRAFRDDAPVDPERPGGTGGEQRREPLPAQTAPPAFREDHGNAFLDAGEAVRQRAEVARRERRLIPHLGVVGADRVDSSVEDACPERLDVLARAEWGSLQPALGVVVVVAGLVEDEVVGADLGPDRLAPAARAA